ncbi:MAG: biotin--[acetyl-CoA-carboxylase] ligase [Propionibacteriales bacterium]|nr:MAG: biotin--[acetyl-CoA-carboxylase] ligase [Propionibacteriales bacterium]
MQLRDVLPDWHIEWVEETGSTNHDLASAARDGASAPRALIADHQHAGRGRFDRCWQAPPGTSLAISVLVAPQVPIAQWSWGSMLAALAVREACTKAGAADVTLKWPNDVLAPDGKLCGILAERVQSQDSDLLVIGMGINTSMSAGQLPVPTATSLQLVGADPDPMPLVKNLLTEFNLLLERWNAGESLIGEYRAVCSSIGRRVRVLRSVGQPVEGMRAWEPM